MTIDAALEALGPKIGETLGTSQWIQIDQQLIDSFAALTFDEQWIHIDPERAATESPFGTTVAHGFLTLSLASRFAYDVLAPLPGQTLSVNYGFDKLRFLQAVPPGARVRGQFKLEDVIRRSDAELMRVLDLTIEIEGQTKPAIAATWLTLSVFGAATQN